MGGFPTWLRPVGEWNPLTAVIQASRELFGIPGQPVPDGWPAQHAVLYAVLSSVAIIAGSRPLAVARYHRVASR